MSRAYKKTGSTGIRRTSRTYAEHYVKAAMKKIKRRFNPEKSQREAEKSAAGQRRYK